MPIPKSIAIVDDDRSVRDAICELLTVAGYHCETFAGARMFLAAAPKAHFDALITDIRMPGMSGIELLNEMAVSNWQLPVVVVSSVPQDLMSAEAAQLGVFAWLPKPVSDRELLGCLEKAFEQPRDPGRVP